MAKEFKKGKMVPVPSHSIVPERDVNKLPVLECQHLGIDFGGLTAVNEFNLTIGRTEIAGLIGPNGAGKTTVFNLLTKVYQPTRGTILLNGKDTHGMSTAQVNRAGIARTFQNIRLFSNLSVEDNGLGMTEEQVERLFTDTGHVPSRRGSGIGVKNVNERIHLYFGKNYGLSIESEPDEGTTVRIHLPAIAYEEAVGKEEKHA